MKAKRQKGVVALSVTLLLGAIIVEIGAIGVLLAYTLNSVNYGARLASEALFAARAGVSDALLRLIRNKNFVANPPYALSVGSRNVEVKVCNNEYPCGTPNPGKAEIISSGKAFPKSATLQAVVDIAPVTGEIRLASIKEL
jgi:hypothetical protein